MFLLQQNIVMILMVIVTFSPFFFLMPFFIPLLVPFFLYYTGSSSTIISSTVNNYPHEKWFFTNSISVPHWWLQQNGRRIEQLFDRPVTLIHNRTFGLLFDLLDCILGRTYNFSNETIETSSRVLKEALVDVQIKKVVLLSHGKGGIIAYQLAEELLMDPVINDAEIKKLEIYTFGCAAKKFRKDFSCIRMISHVEHFANSHDYIAQIGVLEFKKLNQENYIGHLFEAYNKGHFFNQHYSHLLEKKKYLNAEGIQSRLYSYLVKEEQKFQCKPVTTVSE